MTPNIIIIVTSTYYRCCIYIQYGSGIHEMKPVKTVLDGIKEAGLELVGFRNCHHEGDKPWSVRYTMTVLYVPCW